MGRGGCGRRCDRSTAPARRPSSTSRASGRALVDRRTGELRPVELFVSVLGASNLTYAEATRDPAVGRLGRCAHIHGWSEYFGGSTDDVGARPAEERHHPPLPLRGWTSTAPTRTWPPTTARSSCRRGRGSRGIRLLVEKIVCSSRNGGYSRVFATRPSSSSVRSTRAIRDLLDELNDRPMKRLGVSRRALYEQLDRPALRPLPAPRATSSRSGSGAASTWTTTSRSSTTSTASRTNCSASRSRSATRRTTVEIFFKGRDKRIDVAPAPLRPPAVDHRRAHAQRPPRARRVVAVAPDPLGQRRSDRRPRQLVTRILESRPHPEQGYRPCAGDHATGAAVTETSGSRRPAPAPSRSTPAAITPSRTSSPAGQDRLPIEPPVETNPTPTHANIRGSRRTTPRPPLPRRTHADRTDARQAQRHEAGRDGRRLPATDCRPTRPSRSASRSGFGLLVDAEWTAREQRKLRAPPPHCEAALPGVARSRRLHPLRAGSIASRS